MPLHPEAQHLLAALAEENVPPFEEMTVEDARASAKGFAELQGDPVELASVVDRTIPGPAGDVPVRIYTPEGDGPLPVIVYFHGGGWVIGDIEVSDKPCRQLAAAAGAVIVSVEYRLAPEHRYPAAFEDCYAATAWVAGHADELGVDASKLAVSGDSAGGNLAAVVALAAHNQGGPAISAQVLLYPVTNPDFNTESYLSNADGYLLTRGSMQWFWAHYLGDQDADQYAAPLRAESLEGLPPTYLATAEFDPLRDEGESYGKRLADSGVSVTSARFDGMVHGFFWTLAATPSASHVVDDIVAFLRGVWN
ncbi:alpha/beta hydrolase [Pseudonocardia spinosispora]|uniref:alpha/beta hydrolase n=1 Tax=Pseudonocardia spinosispora TaxID=103441 RepID=UPI0004166B1F|nr:alpha/beta hydrolase [Pseudonocardia spinosispora]